MKLNLQNKWIPLLIIFLVAAGTAVGIFYYYSKIDKELSSLSTEVSKPIDTSNWKTYKNEKYGFEIKYPKSWVMAEVNSGFVDDDGAIVTFETPDTDELIEEKMISPGYRHNLVISYWDTIGDEPEGKINNLNAKSIPDYLKKNPFVQKISETTIAGYKAYEILSVGYGQAYGIWIDKEGHVYKLYFSRTWDKSKLGEIENNMLSTFKFID